MFLTLLYPIVLGAALRVDAEVSCPKPAEVSANVQQIVDISDESAAKVHATLRRDGAWLVLNLAEADGTSLGERRLAYDDDCQVLARAAAVVFAAWLSEERPEYLVTLPPDARVTPNDAAAAPTAGEASPAAATTLPPPPTRVPEPPPARVVVPGVDAKPQSPSTPHHVAVSAAIGGTASGSQFAPTALLALSWDPGARGFGARLSAAWSGARSQPLQDSAHEVSWTRWPLLAGPFLRLPSGRFSFDLEAGAALGWLRLRGRGFAPNLTDSDASFGGYAALRFVPQDAPLHAFVQVTPLLWFKRATASAKDPAGTTATSDLPSFEALFSLGAQLPQ